MKTQSVPPVAKMVAKTSYGMPVGSYTHTPTSVAFLYFCDVFIDRLQQLNDVQNLKVEVDTNDLTSFSFNKKVHFKLCHSVRIESDNFYIKLLPYGKEGIDLFKIETTNQGNGLGSKLVMLMNEISESHETPIYLRPTDYKNTSLEQLRAFWSRMGFKRCCKGYYWSNSNPTK